MKKLTTALFEIRTSNISNIITKIILKNIKKTSGNFIIKKINADLQGEFVNYFNGILIYVNQDYVGNKLVQSYMAKSGNIYITIQSKIANDFRNKDEIAIDTLRRELLVIIEHEVTHVIQKAKYPNSMKINTKFKIGTEKFLKKYGTDYREIEAHSNQLIKLAKDYKIDLSTAINYFSDRFNIDTKLLYKKL